MVNTTRLSAARGPVVAGLAAVIIAMVVGVTVGLQNGPSPESYCLYIGTNQAGKLGTLAVPQPNSTQSSCNALEESVQILFANWQTRNESFAISGDHPLTLSSDQAADLKPFTAQPGWLIYSGHI
jgi:hypothetical protein